VKITGMNPDELKPAPSDGEEGRSGGGLMTKVEGAGQGRASEALSPDVLKRAYYNQPVWKRIVVIGAGPAMNLLLAFVILFAVSLSLSKFDGKVGAVESGTPAAAHLQTGDKILAVDGRSFPNLTQQERAAHFINIVSKHKCAAQPPTDGCKAQNPVDLRIQRNGQVEQLSVTPFYDEQTKRMRLGFSYGSRSIGQSPPAAAGHAASEMWRVTSGTLGVFGKIFEPQQRKKIHGIVGISDVTRQAFSYGAVEALTLIAFISLSLAIINLFPFLPLDGGHIFWSLVEKVRGRPVPFSVMERASVVGFLLVMILFAIGLSNDIHALNNGGLQIR
jgi:regulator of sigma E protease